VKQAFEQYATGKVTLDKLRNFFAEHGVRTRNAKLVGRAFVSHLLSNPMYYGHFRYNGEVHAGIHQPIISKKLFDEANAVLDSRWKWSPKEKKVTPKALLGLLRCAECGGAITAECKVKHQKNGNVHHFHKSSFHVCKYSLLFARASFVTRRFAPQYATLVSAFVSSNSP